MTRSAAITGIGIITSLGQGADRNWARLTAGESGIHPITRFPVHGLKTTFGGSVDFMGEAAGTAPDRSHLMATTATREAIAQSGIAHGAAGFPGALFLAAPPVEAEWPQRFALDAVLPAGAKSYADLIEAALIDDAGLHPKFLFGYVAERLAEEFGTRGSPITLTTACASGASAIQLGVEAIRRGDAPAALAVGTDGSMHAEAMIRFSLLSALSTRNDDPAGASRPFSIDRDGFVLAEGAAALVLEDPAHARARGATILGYIRGTGETADTFHRTRSHPSGDSIVAAINQALADAGVDAGAIDYINAHGTSTPENDKMEALAAHRVFGPRAEKIPISSNKSMIGHTLSAAGAIEAVISVLTLRNRMLPPTINHKNPDPAIAMDVVPNQARAANPAMILSNSFGFGGQNLCLVIGAEES